MPEREIMVSGEGKEKVTKIQTPDETRIYRVPQSPAPPPPPDPIVIPKRRESSPGSS
jgi:hypothetical protein